MSAFCWGNTENGELGIGASEEEQILAPIEMQWSEILQLSFISCGTSHTLLLMNDGRIFSCGNNDYGQLGHQLSQKRPQLITELTNNSITQICAGNAHSLAVNEWGQLFSWGSNNEGQLGLEVDQPQVTPKIVRSIVTKHVVQVACGLFHSLVLTNSGELYSFGANSYGQLGLGYTCDKVTTPALINSISGIPIAFIACGGHHSFAISKSGAVYGWGKNIFGQLGLSDTVSRMFPTQLKALRSIGVCYISCGDDFSVFLTRDGGVLTCGQGSFGQLGHGTSNNEVLPRKVLELMGSTVTQIACGRRHTLVTSQGRMYGFGIGGSGQLGNRTGSNSSSPSLILGPWSQPRKHMNDDNDLCPNNLILHKDLIVKRLFSGGDRSFALFIDPAYGQTQDLRSYPLETQILELTIETAMAIRDINISKQVDLDLISTLEVIFKSISCLNGSFLLKYLHQSCSSKNPGVSMTDAQIAFEHIQRCENENINALVYDSLCDIVQSLKPSPPDVEVLRIYLLLPLYHEFVNCKNYQKLHIPFSRAMSSLHKIPLKIIHQWWGMQNKYYFERLIESYKSVILYILNNQFMRKAQTGTKILVEHDSNLVSALKFIEMCYVANAENRVEKVPYDVFHLPELNEIVNIKNEYLHWVMDGNDNKFHLCSYPFLFDAKAKTCLLQTDQAIQMHQAMQSATAAQGLMGFFGGGSQASLQQFLVLNVSRENIVHDTITELSRLYGVIDLKKPLKVKFYNEEAEDAGGVRKEFFMLLLREILDPKYGMFRQYEESHQIWFSEDSFESEHMYALIGILVGLAIYNFTIINLPFPLALYKKILGEPVDLSDLKDLSPVIAKSMNDILECQGDIKDIFNLTFEITRESFGEIKTVHLKECGDKIDVTQENKQEFVDLYVDFVLNKSVEKSFTGFYDGLMRVCNLRILGLFKAHELMHMVIGNEEYDWHAFQGETEYKNGYTSSDQVIQWFWEVFHELSLEEKKNFLLFLTGSDRVPITGMKGVKIFIQPVHDDKYLPVAHTCFNLLDLPRYSTKERLRYKLLQSIQQTQGFSLV